ncbi:MAG: carbohydrate kinase [Rhodobacterales bacterium]|nr:carbohydrate kinase [Rhodobacterales bacterium]
MIICCGEALIDMLPREVTPGKSEAGGLAFLPVPGGAVFNTAVALGRLGEDVGFLSGLSTDMFGRRLAAHLADSGVDTGLCVRSPRPTTLAFVTLSGGNASYTFYDENTAGRLLDIPDLPVLPAKAAALHFGAISLIPEPCGAAYEHLMARHADRAVISFDPNIRPGFVTNETAYRARLTRMAGLSDIIKVSQEDLDWLAPGLPFDAVARAWIADGARLVILTRGAEGARAVTAGLDLAVPARPAKVVDTVGAGDTFNAGLLAGLRRRGVLSKDGLAALAAPDLTAALDLAAAVSAFTVGQAGANPPWQHQLP